MQGSNADSATRDELDQATDLAADPAFEPQHGRAQHGQRTASNQAQLPVLPQVVLPHAAPTLAQTERFRALQGLSLSQIDASVFAALPAQHQQELLNNLPKNINRQDGTAVAAKLKPAADDFGFITKLANLQKAVHGEAADAVDMFSEQHAALHSHKPTGDETATAPAAAAAHNDTQRPGAPMQETSAGAVDPLEVVAKTAGAEVKISQPSVPAVHADSGLNSPVPAKSAFSTDHSMLSPPPLRNSASPVEGERARHAAPYESTASPQLQQARASQQAPGEVAAVTNGAATVADVVDTAQAAAQSPVGKAADEGSVVHAHLDYTMHGLLEADAQGFAGVNDEQDQQLLGEDFHIDFDEDMMEEERAALAMHAVSGPSMPKQPQQQNDIHPVAESNACQSGQSNSRVTDQGAVHAEPMAGSAPQQAKQGLTPAVAVRPTTGAFLSASQIDASVLDALPLSVRRELELAYGMHCGA